MMTDPLLAQSAVGRLVSTANELIIEGQSYRRRQKPSISHASSVSVYQEKVTTMITHDPRWSLPRDNTPVPSRWQATWGSVTVALVASMPAPCHERGVAVGASNAARRRGGPRGQGTLCGPIAQGQVLSGPRATAFK
jgi:hypothetical protein